MLVDLIGSKEELNERLGWDLEAARDYHFEHNGDRYGWVKGSDGNWHFTLFIQNGRSTRLGRLSMMTGLREIAKDSYRGFPT